jgi:hypothetical protein
MIWIREVVAELEQRKRIREERMNLRPGLGPACTMEPT